MDMGSGVDNTLEVQVVDVIATKTKVLGFTNVA